MPISGYGSGYGSRCMSRPSPETIASALAGEDLYKVDEVRSQAPAAAGFYAWWCRSGAVPGGALAPAHPAGLNYSLLYVGIAPNSASSTRDLRQRLRQHTSANIGSSTFRFSIAALVFEEKGWTPHWTDRACLDRPGLEALLDWQRANLRARWHEVAEPWALGIESAVIEMMEPPLNRDHNETHPFYEAMGDARDKLRDAARLRQLDQ